ncbi:hypothetical protein DMI69_07330 [Escherichia coli]|nr:hypothetical protein [Escherichia coli]
MANSGTESNWKPQRSSEGKTMRLLRNKVTDAEIAEGAGRVGRGSLFSHDGKRTAAAAYGARTAPSRYYQNEAVGCGF